MKVFDLYFTVKYDQITTSGLFRPINEYLQNSQIMLNNVETQNKFKKKLFIQAKLTIEFLQKMTLVVAIEGKGQQEFVVENLFILRKLNIEGNGQQRICRRVNGALHNGSVAAFGPGDLGSNPGWSAVFKFKLIFG